MRSLVPTSLLILIATACAPAAARSGFSGTLAWSGFTYRWAKHPHRLSILGSRLEVKSVDPSTGAIRGEHKMSVKIGACPPDAATYRTPFEQVRSKRVGIGHGVIRGLKLEGSIDRWATAKRRVRMELSDLSQLHLPPGIRPERVVVLLNGFSLRSPAYDLSRRPGRCRVGSWLGRKLMELGTGCPPSDCKKLRSGWHFGGLGIHLGKPRLAGSAVEFPVRVRVRPAESPDPVNGGDCRCYGADWPRAIPTRYEVDVHYTVLAGAAADLTSTTTRATVATPRWTRRYRRRRLVQVRGARGFAGGFVGLTGFDVAVTGKGTRPGRYIRRLTARVGGVEYDPASGTAKYRAYLGFSNRSPLAHKWKLAASLDAALIQIRDPDFGRKPGAVRGAVTPRSPGYTETKAITAGW